MISIAQRTKRFWLVLAVTCVAATPAAWANDAAAWGRAMQGVNQWMQQQEARERRVEAAQQRQQAEAQRRQAQDAAQQSAEMERRQAQQQLAADAARASEAARMEALRAPGRYAGRLVLHRALLQSSADTPPGLTLVGRSAVAISPDGKHLAWVARNGDVVVWPEGKVLRAQSAFNQVWFLGTARLIARDMRYGGPAELLDLQGTSVQRWAAIRQVQSGAQGQPLVVIEGDAKRCTRVVAYDSSGAVLAHTDLSASAPPDCTARYANGALEVLATTPDAVTYYRGNEALRRTQHADGGGEQAPGVTWVGATPYALSTRWNSNLGGGESGTTAVLWVPQSGASVCRFTGDALHMNAVGERLYRFTPAGELTLSSCTFRPLGGPASHLIVAGERAVVTDARSGEVFVLDAAGKPALTVNTGLGRPPKSDGYDSYIILAQVNAESNTLTVFSSGQGDGPISVFDIRSGARLAELPAPAALGGWGQRLDYDAATQLWTSRLWQPDLMRNPALDDMLARAVKGSYETTEAFHKRLEKTTLPHVLQVELIAYDADRSKLDVRYRGMKFGLLVPPEQAQQLEGRTATALSGQLRVVEPDFLELTRPVLDLGEGRSVALQMVSCPASLASLSSRMPAYQAARLSRLRTQILGTSIDDTVTRARRAGFDRVAAIRASYEQAELSDRDAESVLASPDATLQRDIRRAATGELPLRYDCAGTRGEAVCQYVEQRWRALAAREVAKAMECRDD